MSRDVIHAAEGFVGQVMAANDPSHDHVRGVARYLASLSPGAQLHVDRVRRLALVIAGTLPPVDQLVVELAALLHDLNDRKYARRDGSDGVEDFSALHSSSLDAPRVALVQRICENVSYSKEVQRLAGDGDTEWHRTCLELHCVQDADKLDAMGAIGVMRCAAYSAVTHRPLTAPDEAGTAVAHFGEKLLRLQGMLKTERGRQMGESRHAFMLAFLAQLEHEGVPQVSLSTSPRTLHRGSNVLVTCNASDRGRVR
jgi:uncharacterized protein